MEPHFLGILVTLVVVAAFTPIDQIWNFLKMKYFEWKIGKQMSLLKQYKEEVEVVNLNSSLLDMFKIYEWKLAHPIILNRLFPWSKSPTQEERKDYALKINRKFAPYFTLFRNIETYNYGFITLAELVRKMG